MTGETLGHFEITGKLGEGGMGVLYRARDTRLGRTVAIKLLRPETVADPERTRRFLQEARAVSALNHPNIVTVHDIGEDAAAGHLDRDGVHRRREPAATAGARADWPWRRRCGSPSRWRAGSPPPTPRASCTAT